MSVNNNLRLHVPGFVEVGDDFQYDYPFETTEDLLALAPVAARTKDAGHSHFVLNDRDYLMQITHDGFHWWVVGRVSKPGAVTLPKWDGGKWLARLPDGTEAVLTDEVQSSCGNVLTLRDGRTAINVLRERDMQKQERDRAKEDRGICSKCDVPCVRIEVPWEGVEEMTRVDLTCPKCGWRRTHGEKHPSSTVAPKKS